jgi:GNAT superfamily N-acetyltransferase
MVSSVNVKTPHGTLSMRPETEHDADAVFAFHLFSSTKAAEMALMPLDEPGRTALLRMQFRSMTETYRHAFPNARFDIVELDGTPIGRLVTDVRADCVYYVDIALLPERQGGGIATTLMNAVLEEPRRLGLPGRVKVLSTNTASLRLCQRLGMTLHADMPPHVELEWRAQPERCASNTVVPSWPDQAHRR